MADKKMVALHLRKKDFEMNDAKDVWRSICKQLGADPYAEYIIIKSLDRTDFEVFAHEEDVKNYTGSTSKKALNPNAIRQLKLDIGKNNEYLGIVETDERDDEIERLQKENRELKEYIEKMDVMLDKGSSYVPTPPSPAASAPKEEKKIDPPPANELSEEEKSHAAIIERIAGTCYSKKKSGFTDRDKLQKIESELINSKYKKVNTNNHFDLYVQPEFGSVPKDEPVFIVSSHADNVTDITKPFSKVSENGWFLQGTYDNMGTNAACVTLMKEFPMPKNVIFAFTANEESGACTGLHSLVNQLKDLGYTRLVGIALDVTYEGHDEGCLYTIENASNDSYIESLSKYTMDTEPEGPRTFTFVPLKKKLIPQSMPREFISANCGLYDEGVKFKDLSVPGCSICLPCTGEMHSNSGTRVRQATYEGYLLSLATVIYSLTQTNEKLIEEFKEKRSELVQKNQIYVNYEAEKRANSRVPSYYSYYGGTTSDSSDYENVDEMFWEEFTSLLNAEYEGAFDEYTYSLSAKKIQNLIDLVGACEESFITAVQNNNIDTDWDTCDFTEQVRELILAPWASAYGFKADDEELLEVIKLAIMAGNPELFPTAFEGYRRDFEDGYFGNDLDWTNDFDDETAEYDTGSSDEKTVHQWLDRQGYDADAMIIEEKGAYVDELGDDFDDSNVPFSDDEFDDDE